MTSITLSVVIPTFNRCDSLRITLDGLARQTYPAELFEVLVVSDGSTDNTSSTVAEYSSRVKNAVRFIEQINSGPSAARNRGIAEAANDIVVFLDDDVEPTPQFLQHHARRHADDNLVAVIGPMSPDPALRTIEQVWISWEHEKLLRVYGMFQPGGAYPTGEGGPHHFYSGNASVSRTVLQQAGGFDERYKRQEDVELAERLDRSFGVKFVFEFQADGIHRPSRSFKSWLNIPHSYGLLDAQRLVEGTAERKDIRGNLANRHLLNRLVINAIERSPFVANIAIGVLKSFVFLTASIGLRRISITLLSGLYNAIYARSLFRADRTAGNLHPAK